ncbi:hypothetical protein BZG36_03923 [Bifiguratus adelaidae]|uniref:Plasma membrane proteolipid 3 n=1 Tax=Bifiguratus adelaidae TaxID=1938954 RepID=A0A261XZG1_9FUNG|nr:hypothetical protein BZG36_03923 [Bifiguratus adelaidae]
MTLTGADIIEIIVAIIFPPAAVAMVRGCGGQLCLNILLTILGYIPGHIHAFYIIWKKYQAQNAYGARQAPAPYVSPQRYGTGPQPVGRPQPVGGMPANAANLAPPYSKTAPAPNPDYKVV